MLTGLPGVRCLSTADWRAVLTGLWWPSRPPPGDLISRDLLSRDPIPLVSGDPISSGRTGSLMALGSIIPAPVDVSVGPVVVPTTEAD